jgi:hypothetical protein
MKIITWRSLPLRELLRELRIILKSLVVVSLQVSRVVYQWLGPYQDEKKKRFSLSFLSWVCELLPHCGTSIFHSRKLEDRVHS